MGKPRRVKRWGGWGTPNGVLTCAMIATLVLLAWAGFTTVVVLTKGFTKPLPKSGVSENLLLKSTDKNFLVHYNIGEDDALPATYILYLKYFFMNLDKL